MLWGAEDLGGTVDHSRIYYYLIYKTVVLPLLFIQLTKIKSIESTTQIPYISWYVFSLSVAYQGMTQCFKCLEFICLENRVEDSHIVYLTGYVYLLVIHLSLTTEPIILFFNAISALHYAKICIFEKKLSKGWLFCGLMSIDIE